MKATVTSLKQETLDGKGKELIYLILEEGEHKVVINIGEKTRDKINELNKKIKK
jgi:hypothetical protein